MDLRMDRISLRVSGLVGVMVAAVISQSVLLRASWLLPADFDRAAFLIRIGSGPLAALVLLVVGVITFFGCRSLLARFATRLLLSKESFQSGVVEVSRLRLFSRTALFAVRGIVAGLLAGASIAWIAIAIDGMGNGGDTSIVRYALRDVVESSLVGMAVFLIAVLSLRPRRPDLVFEL